MKKAKEDTIQSGKIEEALGINQNNSGIDEPKDIDGDDASLVAQICNGYRHPVHIVLLRFLLVGIGYFLFVFVTYKIQQGETWETLLFETIPGHIITGALLFFLIELVPRLGKRVLGYKKDLVGTEMAHWYSPGTYLDLVYFHFDPTRHQDLREGVSKSGNQLVHDENERANESGEEEYWFDFLADTGDGFNPSYAVYTSIAQKYLSIEGTQLPRAESVIVGGDLCYPVPRHRHMMSKFIRPLSWARPLDSKEPRPRMYILPGNHEYMDGLKNYTRLILNRSEIGQWKTPVVTPYYVVELPNRWFVLCIDCGSDKKQDMDEEQVEYFTNYVKTKCSEDSDRFIVVTHEPDWIKNSGHNYADYKNLQIFRHEVLGSRCRLSLAGDLHYYRRMEQKEGKNHMQLVVAGHGGAFSHPTNSPEIHDAILGYPHVSHKDPEAYQYTVACNYPSESQCKDAYKYDWLVGIPDKSFGHVTAFCYMVMLAAVHIPRRVNVSLLEGSSPDISQEIGVLYASIFISPFLIPGIAIILTQNFIFAFHNTATVDFKSVRKSVSLAVIHTLMNMVFFCSCALGIYMLNKVILTQITQTMVADWGTQLAINFANLLLMYILGYSLGPIVTHFYLSVGIKYLNMHYNEAYAIQEIQERKGFLRFKLNRKTGDLTCHSLYIKKTPRSWRETSSLEQKESGNPSIFVPKEGEEIRIGLIEKFEINRD